jgi:hypothetical protein
VALLAVGAAVGCRKTGVAPSPPALPVAPLSLLPADTQLVVSVDLARLRQAPVVAKMAAADPFPAALVQAVDAFTKKTGVDLWRELDSLVLAGASAQKWAVVARAPRSDRARLEAAAREALPTLKVSVPDEHTLVLSTVGWAQAISTLSGGGATAASNADLAKLCQSVAEHPIWGAVIVSERLRDEWLDNLQQQEAAYLDRMTVGVDVAAGVEGMLTVTLTEATQADKLAEDIANQLVRARRGLQEGSMHEGLLKGLTTYSDGRSTHVSLSLGEALLVPWARAISRYWRYVATKLPEPSQRATPLRLQPSTYSKSAALALGGARVFAAWEDQRYALVEVTNRSNRPVAAGLRFMYRRQSGDMLGPGRCVVPTGLLLPGEKSVCVGPAPVEAVSANCDIDLADAKTSEARTSLKVLRAALGPSLGPVQWVAGRVRNESRAMLEHPQVHVIFYDAAGNLVGYGRDDLGGKPLLPGIEAPFQVSSLFLMPTAATTFTVATFASK